MEYYHELTDDFIKTLKANGRKTKFLEFFKIIQRAEDEFIINNQKHVLNLFLDNDNKYEVLFLKESDSYQSEIFDFVGDPSRDEPYDYHAKLIEVLAFTTIGKEGLATSETKLRQTL